MYETVEYIALSKFSLCSLCESRAPSWFKGFERWSSCVWSRKMREEVAKIWSFGSAANLQFESISFNW